MGQVEKITVLKKGAKTMRGRTAEQPEMESQLFHEFKETRQVERPVKRCWFVRRGNQILNEKNLDMNSDFQIIGLSDFRIDTTFLFKERLAAH